MPPIQYKTIIDGNASGKLLVSDTGLSFWGGVNPTNGLVIDQHHPLHNEYISGKILALPSGRGSSSGSGVILELLQNDVAPAALIFKEPEDIITLGVLVSEVMFEKSIPVCQIDSDEFELLTTGLDVQLGNGTLKTTVHAVHQKLNKSNQENSTHLTTINLTKEDQRTLEGYDGEAAKLAMQIVVRVAELQGASELIDVEQAHIDACVYNGPSSLQFAQKLASLNGQVKIPTTLNSLSVDKRRWKEQGVDDNFGTPASELGDAFLAIGARPSYTCAPYLLDTAPAFGQQIVWAESNAVTYANSVIGARTQKYPDFLDACIALTARAPATGAHSDNGRIATLRINVTNIDKENIDDAFWPLLGYHIGAVSKNDIPIIYGLEDFAPTTDNHKAFSAAFATTSSVPMYHINAITPEADFAASSMSSSIKTRVVNKHDLRTSWQELNSAADASVDAVCLGNPHFSATECASLAALCKGRNKSNDVSVMVTLGRAVYEAVAVTDDIETLEAFGVQFINDTCWCMIEEPIIPAHAKILMTNSGKYAHYGPGLVDRPIHFGSLAQCVDAACSGEHDNQAPHWLRG